MDVVLLLSSYALARQLPLASNTKSFATAFFRTILFQALVLFALAILEVVSIRFSSHLLLIVASLPEGWFHFTPHISLVSAYRLTLGSLSVSLCMYPLCLGIQLYALFMNQCCCNVLKYARWLWSSSHGFHILPTLTSQKMKVSMFEMFRQRSLLLQLVIVSLCILTIYGGRRLLSLFFTSVCVKFLLPSFYKLGLLLCTTIDGIGSVLLPSKYISGIFFHSIKEHDIKQMEDEHRQLCRWYKELTVEEEKTCEFHFHKFSIGKDAIRSKASCSEPNRLFGSNIIYRIPFVSNISHAQSLNRECIIPNDARILQALIQDLENDILETKEIRQMRLDSQTLTGKLKVACGLMLSAILILRVIMALKVILPSQRKYSDSYRRQDPISTILLWFMGQSIISKDDYATLSEVISLVLSVFLSSSQIRTFLRLINTLMNNCKRESENSREFLFDEISVNARGDFILMAAAFMMGCYFLSCVTLIKRSLPVQFNNAFFESIGNHRLELSSRSISITFTFSSLTGLGLVLMSFGIKKFISARVIDNMHIHEKV